MMASPLTPGLAQHEDPDCTGTWRFEIGERAGVAAPVAARCTRCSAVREFSTAEEAAPYAAEATLHAHLLARRV